MCAFVRTGRPTKRKRRRKKKKKASTLNFPRAQSEVRFLLPGQEALAAVIPRPAWINRKQELPTGPIPVHSKFFTTAAEREREPPPPLQE